MSDTARADRFSDERPRLVGLAYRMLGSRTDAEDVVQEAWIRYAATAVEPDNPAAWLTTVTSRLALDRLRSAPVRRERYVGPWLPEPVRTRYGSGWAEGGPGRDPADPDDPAEIVDRAATLTLGFLVVLDTLSPEDRRPCSSSPTSSPCRSPRSRDRRALPRGLPTGRQPGPAPHP